MKPIFVIKTPIFKSIESFNYFSEDLRTGLEDYHVVILEDDSCKTITCELFCVEKCNKLSSDKLDELVSKLNK